MDDPKSICYTLTEKSNMLVVSFNSDLNSELAASLDVCREEILKKAHIQNVVLFFQSVDSMSSDVISLLTQMQREIRSKPAELRVCALRPNLKEKLIKMGIVRGLELSDDLKTALLSFQRAS